MQCDSFQQVCTIVKRTPFENPNFLRLLGLQKCINDHIKSTENEFFEKRRHSINWGHVIKWYPYWRQFQYQYFHKIFWELKKYLIVRQKCDITFMKTAWYFKSLVKWLLKLVIFCPISYMATDFWYQCDVSKILGLIFQISDRDFYLFSLKSPS